MEWYRNSCRNGKLSESEIKVFKLSGDDLNRDKKMFQRAMEKLVRKDASTQKTLLGEIKKFHHKGKEKASRGGRWTSLDASFARCFAIF